MGKLGYVTTTQWRQKPQTSMPAVYTTTTTPTPTTCCHSATPLVAVNLSGYNRHHHHHHHILPHSQGERTFKKRKKRSSHYSLPIRIKLKVSWTYKQNVVSREGKHEDVSRWRNTKFWWMCVCVERVTESNGESLPQATATTNGSHFQPMLFFVCFFFFFGVKLYFM